MPDLVIRSLGKAELVDASELCLRSKALWGYDEDFIEACREELTLTLKDLSNSTVVIAEDEGRMVGIAQIRATEDEAELDKLFVEPDRVGRGVGTALFERVRGAANEAGASRMVVTADPDAVPFYKRLGFTLCGEEPSSSIPGRVLPVLTMPLHGAPALQ